MARAARVQAGDVIEVTESGAVLQTPAEIDPVELAEAEARRREVRDALIRENVAGRVSDRALVEALNALGAA